MNSISKPRQKRLLCCMKLAGTRHADRAFEAGRDLCRFGAAARPGSSGAFASTRKAGSRGMTESSPWCRAWVRGVGQARARTSAGRRRCSLRPPRWLA